MDLPIPENVPQHKIRSSHENKKKRVMNNRSVQTYTALQTRSVILRTKQMLKTMHKETLYHLLFECERFRAIREEYPILNKSVKKVFKALDNDDHQLGLSKHYIQLTKYTNKIIIMIKLIQILIVLLYNISI